MLIHSWVNKMCIHHIGRCVCACMLRSVVTHFVQVSLLHTFIVVFIIVYCFVLIIYQVWFNSISLRIFSGSNPMQCLQQTMVMYYVHQTIWLWIASFPHGLEMEAHNRAGAAGAYVALVWNCTCMYVCLSVSDLRLKYTSLHIVYVPSSTRLLELTIRWKT